jgi:hypothetical protein
MSYSSVSAASLPFGASSSGWAKAGESACDGNEQSPTGRCCPDFYWDERVYGEIKGRGSIQHYLEDRLHAAMWMLTAEQIEQVRWDSSYAGDVTVDPGLIARAVSAARNFEDLYPADRWVKVPDAVRTDCSGSPGYSVWEDRGHPRPAVQVAAIQRILGVGARPSDVDALSLKQQAAVWAVPRSLTQSYGQLPLMPSDLFVVDGGQVTATPYMQTFIGAFASAMQLKMALMKVAKKVAPPSSADLAIRRQMLAEKSTNNVKDENAVGMSTGVLVLIVVGVVAAGGVAYWGYKRTR